MSNALAKAYPDYPQPHSLLPPPRRELHDGRIVAMAQPSINHGRTSRNIARIFGNYLAGKKCEVLTDNTLVHLSDDNRFVPDVSIVCRPEIIKENGVFGAPDLVVEVSSPGTIRRDRGHKMQTYAQHGVSEYWIVDPATMSIEVYHLRNGAYVLYEIFIAQFHWVRHYIEPIHPDIKDEEEENISKFKTTLFDDLIINADEVFEGLQDF